MLIPNFIPVGRETLDAVTGAPDPGGTAVDLVESADGIVDVDKAWPLVQAAVEEAGGAATVAVYGEQMVSDDPPVALIPASRVPDVAAALADIDVEQGEEAVPGVTDPLETLQDFYTGAADDDAAVLIVWN